MDECFIDTPVENQPAFSTSVNFLYFVLSGKLAGFSILHLNELYLLVFDELSDYALVLPKRLSNLIDGEEVPFELSRRYTI